jgi:hypothetical protein
MNEATKRVVFWVLGVCAIVAALTCDAEAQEQPKACVNGWVSTNQANYIGAAAKELGWAFHRSAKQESVQGCSVYFIRGDTDGFLVKAHTTLGLFQGMSKRKAKTMMLAHLALTESGPWDAGCEVMDRNGKWHTCDGKASRGLGNPLSKWLVPSWCNGRSEALDSLMLRALMHDGYELGKELPGNPTHSDLDTLVTGVWGECSDRH